jgi:alkanesulfonate monooxygenase SsuD/methylene tetrahydromethanopterin reductase-like flavin-dependent oxidoreductase (luciferase family)
VAAFCASSSVDRRFGIVITRFGSLFAGHVDFDDLGFDASPVNARRLSNERLAGVFDKSRALAQTMDRLGYDTLWFAEHHFQPEGYECIPNIMMLAVHLAHLTRRIRFGCGFNIAPMWHPLRLAEDFAMADILTGGRVIFGVGRGYHTREVETFGAPMLDQAANRALFEEQVDVMQKAFERESFAHHGPHYDLPPRVPYRGYELNEITLVPRPLRRPVEWWQPIVGGSQSALDFMAARGIKGMIGGGAAPGGANERLVSTWRETLARHGRETELGGDLIVGLSICIADSEAQGIEAMTPIFEENMKMFAPLNFVRGLSEEQVRATEDPQRARGANLPTLRDAVAAGSWIIGPPVHVIDRLRALERQYPGLAEVNVSQPVGTPERILLAQLERFATEVMPTFAGRGG